MVRPPAFQPLCLIVFLLAWALPAAAQNGLIRDAKTGCATSNPFPRENETITWTGGCENGLLSGYGVLTWQDGDTPYERDEGVFKDGELDGLAVIAFADGSRVYGRYRAGKRNGDFIIDRGDDALVLARYEAGQFVTERAMSEAEVADWRTRGEAAFVAIMRDSGAGPVQIVGNRDAPALPATAPPVLPSARIAAAPAVSPSPAVASRAPEPSEPDPDFGDKAYSLRLADTDVAAVAAVVFGNLLQLPYTIESGGDERVDLLPAQAVTGNQLLASLRGALAERGLQAVRRKGRYIIAPIPGGIPAPVRRAASTPVVAGTVPAPAPPPVQVAGRAPGPSAAARPALIPPPPAPPSAAPVAARPVPAVPSGPAVPLVRPRMAVPPPPLRRPATVRPATVRPAIDPLAIARPAVAQPVIGAVGIHRPAAMRPGRPRVGGMACLRADVLGQGRRWCGLVQAIGSAGVAVRLTLIDLTGANLPVFGPAVCTGGAILSRFAAGRVIQVPADCVSAV